MSLVNILLIFSRLAKLPQDLEIYWNKYSHFGHGTKIKNIEIQYNC